MVQAGYQAASIRLALRNFFYRLGVKGILSSIILLSLLGGITWLYVDAREELTRLKETSPQAQLEDVVGKVGKLIELPADETPTLATVTDAEKLKDQPFFAKAQNGDKVLIYTKAKIAILYRPGENKLIAVGTVNLNTTGQ